MALIFSVGFFIIGMVLLSFTVNAIKRSRESVNWPSTDGEILSSAIDTSTGMNTGLEYYDPRIVYKYKVREKEYRSSRIYFGSQIGYSIKEEKITSLIKKYQESQRVRVSFDPDNPDLSVLQPGYHRELNFGIGAGIFLIIIACLFLIL